MNLNSSQIRPVEGNEGSSAATLIYNSDNEEPAGLETNLCQAELIFCGVCFCPGLIFGSDSAQPNIGNARPYLLARQSGIAIMREFVIIGEPDS